LARPTGDPDAARLVTSDLPRYWQAFDAAIGRDSATRVDAFEAYYLRPGSIGLQTWIRVRLSDDSSVYAGFARAGWDRARVDRALALRDSAAEHRAFDGIDAPLEIHSAAEQLARVTARRSRYYAAIRPATLALDTSRDVTAVVRASFRRLKALYPDAVFPDVYFLIGKLNTGGTADGGRGLLIGTELNARDSTTPLDDLPVGLRPVVGRLADLPRLVAHEVVHAQQPPHARTLLAQALAEGSADFVADLITPAPPGGFSPHPYTAYGDAHEQVLWAAFTAVMHGSSFQGWLYGGADASGRPADLGYYIGARICDTFYRRAPDKAYAR
jgi:hypothetical protein